jgi:hypothetical protein
MTDEQKPTPDQCREFTMLLVECWHERIHPLSNICWCGVLSDNKEDIDAHIQNNPNPTYDSASILLKMKEKLGEEKYSKFIYQLSSQYFDKNGITRIGQQARLINFLNDYIFNPAALIDKASEYCEKEGK